MKKFYKNLSLSITFAALFCLPGLSQNAWINEIHYNDLGTDTNEFIEVIIESPGNFSLSSFAVVLYNGNNGNSYDTKTLDLFTPGESFEGYVVYYYMYPVNGIQNGDPDGIALVYNENVLPGQFLSYEGAFTATDGPANGMMSVDIIVLETGELEGLSLQLSGQGSEYLNFTWQPPADETHGELNNDQDLLPVGIGEHPALNFNLYPNPNPGNFRLINPLIDQIQLDVFSISGQKITGFSLVPGENSLDTDLPGGIYLLVYRDSMYKIMSTERMIIR